MTLLYKYVHAYTKHETSTITTKVFPACLSVCVIFSLLQWILWSLLSRPQMQITTRSFTLLTRHQWVLFFTLLTRKSTYTQSLNYCLCFCVHFAAWCRVLQVWSPEQWRGDPIQASRLWDQNCAHCHHPCLGMPCTFHFWHIFISVIKSISKFLSSIHHLITWCSWWLQLQKMNHSSVHASISPSNTLVSFKENLTCHYLRKWALLSVSTPAPTSLSPFWMGMTSTHSSCPARCSSKTRSVASAPALCTRSMSQREKRSVTEPSLSHTTNITRVWLVDHQMCVSLQDIVLDFSPGPIHAVDGDTGLSSPLSYAILSGTIHIDAS